MSRQRLLAWAAALVVLSGAAAAQERLKTLPGYEQYQRMAPELGTAFVSGVVRPSWVDQGRAVEYNRDGSRYRFDLATRRTTKVGPASEPSAAGPARPLPARGRQYTSALSPDGRLNAFYRDHNLWLSAADGTGETAITTDGSAASRIEYGTASWVYGEELEQRTAMWWSPDSRRIAFYRFDERQVPDYYVTLDETEVHNALDAEPFPTAGSPNPVVDLIVYDVTTRRSTTIDVRDGQPLGDEVVGYYVYHVMWSPDGSELLFFRTNRRQNVMDVTAASPITGTCRTIVHEAWPTGWVNDQPRLVFLHDGRRFIWESQRNGWDNFYLYDISGRLITPLTTSTDYEVGTLIKVDEKAGLVFYTARDGDNFLKFQLHRVGLDGRGDRRLTDPAYHHSVGTCLADAGPRIGVPRFSAPCGISPDDKYFVDVYQTHDTPPATRIVDVATGGVVADLAKSDMTRFDALGLKRAELFTFTAADHRTTLHGLIRFPSTFDPSKHYPVLVDVYGGPEFAVDTAQETFVEPSTLAEYGFLVVEVDSRAVPGLGKQTLDSLYGKLGQTEVDDMAEGVKALWSRPYVDRRRVGVFGTSYGGYVALMEALRHPDVFAAAAASSPVTDWRNYDTIYTERYMGLPKDNAAGYDAGSAITYAGTLQSALLVYFGTADNNVHPSNTLQLVQALNQAGRNFTLQVGPDRGHTPVNTDRMMEFFIEHLVVQ
jgi:dipeptidyl-peptidase-4